MRNVIHEFMSKEIRHSSYYNSGVYSYGDRSYDDGIGGFSYKLTRHSSPRKSGASVGGDRGGYRSYTSHYYSNNTGVHV